MSRTTWIGGALFASTAAGPVFAAALAATLLASMPTSFGSVLTGFGIVFALSIPVGFVLALLPNIAGTALLALSGTTWPPARAPLAWAANGAAFGWLIGAGVGGSLLAIPMAVTGTACALICRRCVAWPD